MAMSGGDQVIGSNIGRPWRRALVVGSAFLVCATLTSCADSDATATADADDSATVIYGPPASATNVAALGTTAEGVLNVRFVGIDGRNYLVHTGPAPMFDVSRDPARIVTTELADGTQVTVTCAGTITTSTPAGESTGPPTTMAAGPLIITWQVGDQFVTVLSQDDTGPCSPTATHAEAILRVIGSLSRLTTSEWDQLLSEHPISSTGSNAPQSPEDTSIVPH